MKKNFFAILFLISASAQATFEEQFDHLRGTWDAGSGYYVISMSGVAGTSEPVVNFDFYDRKSYLESDGAHAILVKTVRATYNSVFDGFCLPWRGRVCNSGITATFGDGRDYAAEVVDPLSIYGLPDSGRTQDMTRLR